METQEVTIEKVENGYVIRYRIDKDGVDDWGVLVATGRDQALLLARNKLLEMED